MDRYINFAHLSAHERAGEDYAIQVARRNLPIAVITPHGGRIEPATSEITLAIAADDFSFYAFEGLKRRPHSHLHITSSRFDEPQCLDLVSGCATVVAIHGRRGTRRHLEVGGLDRQMRDAISAALQGSGFSAKAVTAGELAGTHPNNICNRGRSLAGAQLEISKALRDFLLAHSAEMDRFAAAVRSAIAATGEEREVATPPRSMFAAR